MRRILDIFIVILIVGVAVAVITHRDDKQQQVDTTQSVTISLARLYERASYHGALEDSPNVTGTVFPVAIRPEWFSQNLPKNNLLATEHPWIDVAPPGDESPHPPDPVALNSDQAGFWYNPNLGLFRARVPAHLSDAEALTLYNQLNGTDISELTRDIAAQRIPLAYTPGHSPASTLASPAYRVSADTLEDTKPAATPAPATAGQSIFSFNPEPEPEASNPTIDAPLVHDPGRFLPPVPVEAAPEKPRERRTSLTTRKPAEDDDTN